MNFNIIKVKNINELNNLVKKGYFNIAFGGYDELNRKILENKNIQLLLDPQNNDEDYMHFKNSGLNQVLVKLAKKNNIAIGFSFNKILKLNNEERVNLLGKIMQNIMLCNKYKVKMYIVNFVNEKLDERNINDLRDFGITLGMLPGKFEILEMKKVKQ